MSAPAPLTWLGALVIARWGVDSRGLPGCDLLLPDGRPGPMAEAWTPAAAPAGEVAANEVAPLQVDVARALARAGLVQPAGRAIRVPGHLRPVPVWRLSPAAAAAVHLQRQAPPAPG